MDPKNTEKAQLKEFGFIIEDADQELKNDDALIEIQKIKNKTTNRKMIIPLMIKKIIRKKSKRIMFLKVKTQNRGIGLERIIATLNVKEYIR
jgi:uncharacterized DUF497 family protein